MYSIVVVRYGEIFLKSEYVKRKFENRFIENIRYMLKKKGLEGKIMRRRHRIYIKTSEADQIAHFLSRVFGVVSVSPAIETSADIEIIAEEGLKLAKKTISEKECFAVRAKRTGQHSFGSMDVERAVASRIIEEIGAPVNLTNPDKTIFVEIMQEDAFVFDKKIQGVGGLPYGTQSKVVALVSLGIDSPVAAWMMMHRGCKVVALHFNIEERTGGIEDILKVLEEFSIHRIKLYVVPYDNILADIAKNSGKYACVICKRTMLRIAQKISAIEKAHGIVTGDSIGQVASQTIENLETLSEVASPIYRPLIGMDKKEIIDKARIIETYKLADKRRCWFVPKKPATISDLDEIKAIESKIGIGKLIDEIDLECLVK